MNALQKEEIKLLELLVQNLKAQLMTNPLWQKYQEAVALRDSLLARTAEPTVGGSDEKP